MTVNYSLNLRPQCPLLFYKFISKFQRFNTTEIQSQISNIDTSCLSPQSHFFNCHSASPLGNSSFSIQWVTFLCHIIFPFPKSSGQSHSQTLKITEPDASKNGEVGNANGSSLYKSNKYTGKDCQTQLFLNSGNQWKACNNQVNI